MLHALLVIIHVIICFLLATVVLLQSSKGGGLAGAFGGAGGAPQQLLGTRGMTTLLHKLTIYCAVGFFLTSFLLFMTQDLGGGGAGGGVVEKAAREGALAVPAQENPLTTDAPAGSPETPAAEPTGDQGGTGEDDGDGR